MRQLIALMMLFFAVCCAPTQSVTTKSQGLYVPRISLVGGIDEDSVAATISALEAVAAENPEAVVLEIDTPGGEVEAGMRLSKAIENYPVRLICIVDGDGASMGFYILQSCPVRLMTKRSTLMIHRPAMVVTGKLDKIDQANLEARLDALANGMMEHIGARMGLTVDEIAEKIPSKYMWWMNWREAVCTNAVDGVIQSVPSTLDTLRSIGSLPEVAGCP